MIPTPSITQKKLYGFPNETETIVNVPDIQGVTLDLDGEPFDPYTGTLVSFRQTLDMAAGQYVRRVVWRSPAGPGDGDRLPAHGVLF